MADYSLGTAHGKIVVDYDDKGIRDADKAFDGLRSAASRLNRAMESASNVAKAGRQHFALLAASVGDVGRQTALAISRIAGLESALDNLGRTAATSVQHIQRLVSSVREFTTISGAFSSIARSAFGINEVLGKFPQWARDILSLNSAILAVRASMVVVTGTSARLGRMLLTNSTASRRFAAALTAGTIALSAYSAGFQRWIRGSILATPLTIKAANATKTFVGQLGPAVSSITNLVRGMSTMVVGAAFMVRGFQGISAAAKLAAKAVGGISLAFAGLSVLGTTVLGLADALKQLSGIALLIPGALTTIGIAGGVALIAFKGIGDAFKAAALEGEDFDKAVEKLSPTMQNIARSAKPFAKEVKNLRDIAQQGVLGDFGTDIEIIGKTYMPVLQKGISQVSGSLRATKNEFRSFLMDPNTVRDTGEAFSLTNEIMRNLSKTVQPLAEAFRNLAIVGMEAMRDLTGGAGSAAERLAQFMWEARQSGKLRGWIDSAIQGFRDLWAILKQVWQISKTVFEAFGSSGENALSRTREALEKFNDRVNESAKNGSLKTIADHLQRMSRTSIQAIAEVFRQIVDVLKAAAPFMEQFSQAMVGTFVGALKIAGPLLEGFFTVLSNFSQLGAVVGILTGIGVAIKVFSVALMPLTRTLALFTGGLVFLRGLGTTTAASMTLVSSAIKAVGASAVVAGVQTGAFGTAIAAIGSRVPIIARMQESFYKGADAASRFGRTAGTIRAAMTGLSGAASSLVSALGGPLVIAIAAVVGAVMAWKSHSDAVKAMNDQIKTSANHAAEGTRNLAEAFKEANGVIDAGVIQVLSESLSTLRQDLGDTASKSTGVFADLGAQIKDTFNWDAITGQGGNRKFNEGIDEIAETARRAGESIDELGLSNEDLSAKIRGSESDWRNLVTQLHNTENGGKEAVAELQKLRDAYTEISTAMGMVTPGGNQLAEAIETIADKSSTAADRLDAMRSALESLGLMSLNAEEAFAQYQQEIDDLSDSSNIAISAAAGLGDAMLLNGGKLDLTNENARNLRQSLIDLGDGFLRSVEGGQNAAEAFDQMQPALQNLANAYGLPIEKIQELVRTAGVVPEVIETLVSLKGQDTAMQQLATLALKAQEVQLQAGQPITMQLSDVQARDTLEKFGFTVKEVSDKAGVFTITAQTPDAVTKLNEVLRIKDLLKNPPGVVPVATSGVPQTNAELGSVENAKDGINGNPAVADVVPGDGIWSTSQELIALTDTQDEINATPVVVEADASEAEVAKGDIDSMSESVMDAAAKMAEFTSAFATAMGQAIAAAAQMSADVIATLAAMAPKAVEAGAALGGGFAVGILSQAQKVRDAALALAEAAAAPLPRSPAKIGPFSGRGWTPYRGRALASGFAQGIYGGSKEAQDATLDMARAISDIIDKALISVGMAETKFNANIENQAGTRYYRDPNISEAQLSQQRQERAEEKAQQEKDDAYREKKRHDLEVQNLNGRIEFEKSQPRENIAPDEAGMQELADKFDLVITSNKRNEPGSFHNTGEAWDISGTPENMMRLNRYLAERDPNARELFYDPGTNIDEGKRIGPIGGHSDHVHYVPSLREYNEDRKTQQTIAQNTSANSKYSEEQIGVATAIIEEGQKQNRSEEEILAALEAGLVESELRNLPYGAEDSVGPLQLRAMHGTAEERMDPRFSARWFYENIDALGASGTSGEIAAQVQRPREDLRYKYGTREAEAQALLASIDTGVDRSNGYQEIQAKTAEELVAEMANQDQELKAAVETLNNQSASDEEIIRALQTIDDKKLTVEDPDVRQQLESLQAATMEDRGLKKYDPFEGASTDLLGDSIRLAQTIVGFVDTIESGINNAAETFKLLVRGISSTKDLNTLVDGFQSMASTVGQIISTVGEVINIVASIAAAAGSAIPGVGAVTGTISAITGGIGNVNAIVDLVQDVLHIGGRIAGGFLSMLAGGANGPLYGNVRTLLDMNDRTIKTWSDRNPAEKTVTGLPGSQATNPNQAPGINNLNIYQGPGQDPADMMNKAMFVVKSHSTGVFAG